MKRTWMKWLAALAAVLVVGSVSVQSARADDDPAPKPPAQSPKHIDEQQKGDEDQSLTPEQQAKRALLRQKWGEIRTLHDEAKQEAQKLHTDLKSLHDLTNKAKEDGDKEKLKTLKKEQHALREHLKRVQELRSELKSLHGQLRQYKEAKDFDAALKTMNQMKPAMEQYRDALRAANQQVQKLLGKLS